MSDHEPEEVDRFLQRLLSEEERNLSKAVEHNAQEGLPGIDVAPNQGKLLGLLVRMTGAQRVLEIGTLGGYSAIWMARGLPTDGRIVTLELDPQWAAVARANMQAAGVADGIEVRTGAALDSLDAMIEAGEEPFDLVFIDADKATYPRYLERSLALTKPGSVILADNIVRDGEVLDPAEGDANSAGARELLEIMAAEPRLDATAIQTVGLKGWDGLAIALVV